MPLTIHEKLGNTVLNNGMNADEKSANVIITADLQAAAQDDTLELLLNNAAFATPLNTVLTASDISTGTYDFTLAGSALGSDGEKSLTVKLTHNTVDTTSAPLTFTLDTTAPRVTNSGMGILSNTLTDFINWSQAAIYGDETGTGYLVKSSLTQPKKIADFAALATNQTQVQSVLIDANMPHDNPVYNANGTPVLDANGMMVMERTYFGYGYVSTLGLDAGTYTMYIVDKAGNISQPLTDTVTVITNHAPTAADKTLSISEGQSYTFTASDFGYSDVDGHEFDQLKITALPKGSLKQNGTQSLNVNPDGIAQIQAQELSASQKLTFTPAASYGSGTTDSFSFKVADRYSTSTQTYTVTFNITGNSNDTPTFNIGDGIVINAPFAAPFYDPRSATASDGKSYRLDNYSTYATGTDFGISRYNKDGSPDNTFGTNGKVSTDISHQTDNPDIVLLQSNGKIIVAGNVQVTMGQDLAFVRYNTDGSLDSSFGNAGIVVTDVDANSSDNLSTALLQSDGKVLALANVNGRQTLLSYNSDGSLDTSFGTSRKVIDNSGIIGIPQIAVQTDGKILLTEAKAVPNLGNLANIAVFRYNSNGSLDSSFGNNGFVSTSTGYNNDSPRSISQTPDGKILVTGNANVNGSGTSMQIRYNNDGSLDKTFDFNPAANFIKSGQAVALNDKVQVHDAELDALNNYNGASLTLARQGGAMAEDVFSSAAFSGANVVVSGTTLGTFSQNGGQLTLAFNSSATTALVNSALQQIAYQNTGSNPPAAVEMVWNFSDGNTGAQGSGGALNVSGSTTVNSLSSHIPAATVSTLHFSNDTGISDTDFILNDPRQTISGTLSANTAIGEVVKISVDSGATYQTATNTVGTNTYTFNGSLAWNQQSVKVHVEDATGLSSAEKVQTYTLDTGWINATVIDEDFTKAGTVVVQSSKVGTLYLVKDSISLSPNNFTSVLASLQDSDFNSVVITDINQNVSIPVAGLTDGSYTLYATDIAGNFYRFGSSLQITAAQIPTLIETIASAHFSNDTGLSQTDFITKEPAQVISGTLSASLSADKIVKVSLDKGANWQTATVTGTDFTLSNVTLAHSDTLQVRVEDNTSHFGSAWNQAYTLDTTPPTASVTAETFTNTGLAIVQSTEIGTAYLVDSTLTQPTTSAELVTLETNNDASVNNVAVSAANTVTFLPAMGLNDGDYKVYTVDVAGNLSTASTNTVTITTGSGSSNTGSSTGTSTGSGSDSSASTDTGTTVATGTTSTSTGSGSSTSTDTGTTDTGSTTGTSTGTGSSTSTGTTDTGSTSTGSTTGTSTGSGSSTSTGTTDTSSTPINTIEPISSTPAPTPSPIEPIITAPVPTPKPVVLPQTLATAVTAPSGVDIKTAQSSVTTLEQLTANLSNNGSTDSNFAATIHDLLAQTGQTTFSQEKIVLTSQTGQTTNQPIVIDGTKGTSTTSKIWVVDTSALPTGATLQLKQTAFAVITGDATVKADATPNTIILEPTVSQIQQTVFTAGSDDTVQVNGGQHLISGGTGVDTIKFTGKSSDYKITQELTKITITSLSNPNDVQTLLNVETLSFADKNVDMNFDTHLNAIMGTYQQMFGRQADLSGAQFWADAVVSKGLSLGEMALEFMQSPEQLQKIGFDINKADISTQVDQFYQSFLGRASDPEGKAFWVEKLSTGTLTLTDLATSIIQSPEMQGHYVAPAQWDFSL